MNFKTIPFYDNQITTTTIKSLESSISKEKCPWTSKNTCVYLCCNCGENGGKRSAYSFWRIDCSSL